MKHLKYFEPIGRGQRNKHFSKAEQIAEIACLLIDKEKGEKLCYPLLFDEPLPVPNKSASYSVTEYGYYQVTTVTISDKFYAEIKALIDCYQDKN